MDKLLLVGLGGAFGAMGRYGISLLPAKADFPLLTLLTNLLGAAFIGFVVGLSADPAFSRRWLLFWKTGVCGGFTTFSAFSLEALGLFEGGKTGLGTAYVALSVGLCLFGVWLGQRLGGRVSALG